MQVFAARRSVSSARVAVARRLASAALLSADVELNIGLLHSI
jgi:hypothetical protein